MQLGIRPLMDGAAEQRPKDYFERIGNVLGDEARPASFATYAMGILGDGERKRIEPIAARGPGRLDRMDAYQRLQHFIADSPWSDRDVRLEAARYALVEMTKREPVEAWILDDTGFLKQGSH